MQKKRIMIVDDEEGMRDILQRLFSKEYDVNVCNNGVEALLWINKEPGRIPHLVITDLNMPGIDGLELSRGIKGTIINLPIILITGRPDLVPETAPVDAVIQKPFDLDHFLETVKRLINY